MKRKPKVNAKRIMEKLHGQKSDRKKITLYLSRKLYEELKARTETEHIAPSQIIEELIKAFLEDLDK